MKVTDLMTREIACCGRETPIREVAQRMVTHDCGCIPLTENADGSGRVVGVVTDRDIACRVVAEGMDIRNTTAGQCMTADPTCVREDTSVEECEAIMQDLQVRRVPVLGRDGSCVGMISQADIALSRGSNDVAEVVRSVSRPYVS